MKLGELLNRQDFGDYQQIAKKLGTTPKTLKIWRDEEISNRKGRIILILSVLYGVPISELMEVKDGSL